MGMMVNVCMVVCFLAFMARTSTALPLSCSTEIEAVSRAGVSRPCSFPFTYKSDTFYGCTHTDYHEPWCGTDNGDPSEREWGICTIKTIGGTAGGAKCEFPFTYRGEVYHDCTMAVSESDDQYDVPWCATTDFYDDDELWGACLQGPATSTTPAGVVMAIGHEDGAPHPCQFPFTYGDEEYTSCTMVDYHAPWCTMDTGDWGTCIGAGVVMAIGDADGAPHPCQFPFTYDDEVYNICTMVDYQAPWCTMDNGDWGTCIDANSTTSPGERIMAIGQADGEQRPCQIPFTYKDKEYSWCTMAEYHAPWCMLDNGDWGTCIIETSNGKVCEFPFTNAGANYTHCTMDDYHLPWCKTTDGDSGTCILYQGC